MQLSAQFQFHNFHRHCLTLDAGPHMQASEPAATYSSPNELQSFQPRLRMRSLTASIIRSNVRRPEILKTKIRVRYDR